MPCSIPEWPAPRWPSKGIRQAKEGNTLGPVTMTLYYLTDFADRLENEIIPALRAGFVVLTDRYIFSIMARSMARGEHRAWIEQSAGFALVPHLVLYLRADVKDLISRVVVGRGAFDYWESGLDSRFGRDMYDSFVRYQERLIRVFDRLAKPYGFEVVDAGRPAEEVFETIQQAISGMFKGSRLSVSKTHPAQAVLKHLVRRALYEHQDKGRCQALHKGRRIVG